MILDFVISWRLQDYEKPFSILQTAVMKMTCREQSMKKVNYDCDGGSCANASWAEQEKVIAKLRALNEDRNELWLVNLTILIVLQKFHSIEFNRGFCSPSL